MATTVQTAAPALVLTGVAKRFSAKQALGGVSLEVRAGECMGLLGPNGAGKSTLVRSIVRRVVPDAGTVLVAGEPAGSAAARARLGYVPQEIALYPLLSARENLAVFGRYQGMRGAELERAIDWALEWAGLRDRAADRTRDLSGGMKRRLNMAAGLLHRPSVVLLDEPTVGVDPQSRERIYTMIDGLRAQGASMVYTTHYMEEAERLCDRIAIMDNGQIIALGTRDELVRNCFGTQADLALTFAQLTPDTAAWLRERGARLQGSSAHIAVTNPAAEIADVLNALRSRGAEVQDLALRQPNLESVFLQLTGRGLRE